jgi:hypothetical protein
MGTEGDGAVVDNEARVFGIKRVRVADASAFPILEPGHPQSTICEYTLPFSYLIISLDLLAIELTIVFFMKIPLTAKEGNTMVLICTNAWRI